MTMHQLTIDFVDCRGLNLCHACEAITPGLVKHCQHYGKLLISWQNTGAQSALLSRLAAACPDRAIMIKPVDE